MQYEYTRTIRFNLSGEKVSYMIDVDAARSLEETLANLLIAYRDLLGVFKKAIFYEDKEGVLRVKSRLEIKKSWLRQYARKAFYSLPEVIRGRGSKFPAKDFEGNFLDWLQRSRDIYMDLTDVVSRPENDKIKRSDISTYIRLLKTSEYFPFVEKLLRPWIANDKDTNEYLDALRSIVERFGQLLDQALLVVSPDLTQGVEIGRASFNYYTVNKISRNFDKDIDDIRNKLESPFSGSLDKQFLEKVGFRKDSSRIPIQELYEDLKRFKAEQKKSFLEATQADVLFEDLQVKYPLFKLKDDQTLQKFKGSNPQKRGDYYRNNWGFSDYKKYCDNIFKPIAIKVGKLKAEIRSLEQEQVDARLLKYWAHIVQKDGRHLLLLIPKDAMQRAKQFLEQLPSKHEGESMLIGFNSLTLRALNKLIRRNLEREQTRLQDDAVSLYQEVLKGQHQRIQLDFNGFEQEIREVASGDYANEESFRIALDRVAYVQSKAHINEEQMAKLQNDFGALVLDISSYDFERTITSDKKEHSQLWEAFWDLKNQNNQFPVRLNPELRIFYRPQRDQEDIRKQKNRFSKNHFGVAFTITQNATQNRMETAFQEEKALLKMVQTFNHEVIGTFVEEKGENLYYYGIDRGDMELATLGVVQFSQERYEAMLAEGTVQIFDTPVFPLVETYRIKEEHLHDTKEIAINSTGKTQTITLFKNPSYFIEEEDKFEKGISPFMDLTTAKLIRGKIILNGDVMTYIALKKANAKRQLFEKLSKIDTNAQIEFDEIKKQFKIKSKDSEREDCQWLPFYSEEQEKVFPREAMRKELQEYLDKLRADITPEEGVSVEKINHLRDAITANMIGIIAFLFEKYPGIINLENLHSKDQIERHFSNNNENIARRLEWSLYKKFQKSGLVPPKLRQTVFLRENETEEGKKLNQFGIIHFVPTKNTSANCPYCGVSVPMKQREKDKFEHHAYICRNNSQNCGFDTRNPKQPFEYIKNSDDVAAYNIAKSKI